MRPALFGLAFTGGSLAGLAAARVDVRPAPLPDGPRRAVWQDVDAALIRPDGYIAHATPSAAGLSDVIAAWTTSDHA